MISFDIETCGVRSNAVLLSVACVRFTLEDAHNFPTNKEKMSGFDIKNIYKNYLDSALFVKFKVEFQMRNLKRSMDKDAMEWWAKLPMDIRKKSLQINGYEVEPKVGIDLIKEYCFFNDADPILWQRGGLDQVVFDDFCRNVGVEPLFKYWNWLDFRTAINLSKMTAARGYCQVPGFDKDENVRKHDPVHDAAYDVLQLVYGE